MKKLTDKEKLKIWESTGKDFNDFLGWLHRKHPKIYREYQKYHSLNEK